MLGRTLALILVLATPAWANPPFPPGMTIQNPNEVSDPAKAALLGVWIGDWNRDETLDGLAVTRINADGTLQVIYAVSERNAAHSHYKDPMNAILQDGTLYLPPFQSGAKVTYKVKRNGTLQGTYAKSGSRSSKAVFRRATLTN